MVSFDTISVSPVTAGSNYHRLVRIQGRVVYEKAETAKTELLSVSVGFLSLMDVNTALGRGGKLCQISVFRFGSLQLQPTYVGAAGVLQSRPLDGLSNDSS